MHISVSVAIYALQKLRGDLPVKELDAGASVSEPRPVASRWLNRLEPPLPLMEINVAYSQHLH